MAAMAATNAGVRGPAQSVFRCAIRWHILVGLSSERLVEHDWAPAATEERSMSDLTVQKSLDVSRPVPAAPVLDG
jgi:hypothetical protein